MTAVRHPGTESLRGIRAMPEFNLAVFALLLNFPWEVLQAPLFVGVADARFVDVIKGCAQATVGDMVILLIGHAGVALVARDRGWVLTPSRRQLAGFVAIGVSITAVIEWLATHGRWVSSWSYAPAMPVVPGLGLGLAPLLQWVVLPLLVVWFVQRQLAGQGNTLKRP